VLGQHPKQDEGSAREAIARAISARLEPVERPAPIAILSAAKRAALVAFLSGDGALYKTHGVWAAQSATAGDRRIFGITVADLARDGMLTVTVIGKKASARLTPRGTWFARTLAAEMSVDSNMNP
jgi:hypothetical protein